MKQVWKPIPNFPGYEASNDGHIRSWRSRRGRRQEPKILNSGCAGSKNEYRAVTLRANGHSFYRRIGPLVALAFLGPRPDGLEVCHNDGDPTNDRLDNLRYDTHKSNMEDAVRQGRFNCLGSEDHMGAKLTNAQVRLIRNRFSGSHGSQTSEAKRYGVGVTAINNVIYGRTYKDAGGPIAEPPHRLSNNDIIEIRQRRVKNREKLSDLAGEFGVSIGYITKLAKGERRTGVGGPIHGDEGYLRYRA